MEYKIAIAKQLSAIKPHQFQYADTWLGSRNRRILSLSMPFQPGNRCVEGSLVEHFFDNLLPDNGEIRHRIQSNFGTKDDSPFSLLAEVGRDCVGAIQLLPIQEEPSGWNKIEARPLSELEVEQHLQASTAKDISPRHFYTVAKKRGLGGEIRKIVASILEMTPNVIRDVSNMLPKRFPMQVSDTIFTGLRESSKKIQQYSNVSG